jgi:hypothetical protein
VRALVDPKLVEHFDLLYQDQLYLDNSPEETLTFDDYLIEIDESSDHISYAIEKYKETLK